MSDLQCLIRQAQRQGWSVQVRRDGHLAWKSPSGAGVIFSGSSPSDWRAQLNLRACLRRAGLHTDGAENHGQK